MEDMDKRAIWMAVAAAGLAAAVAGCVGKATTGGPGQGMAPEAAEMSGYVTRGSVSADGGPIMLHHAVYLGDAAGGGARKESRLMAMMAARQESDTPGYETYAQFDETGFKDTATEPLSTFSADVDTASYSSARRYLTRFGRLPPPDSVRVEEFVNYFRYDDPPPRGKDPIGATLELGECPWAAGHKLLRVALQTRPADLGKAPPNNLVFLVDVSGSMDSPDKLPLLQRAFRMLAEGLRPEDTVSVVTYASGVEVRLEPTNDKARIAETIDRLEAGGATSGGEGLKLAYEQARRAFKADGNNRVILATDGDFNVGPRTDEELVRMVEKERSSGVYLSVLGFGSFNYQGEKMKKIADAGNGNYAYIDNLLEARKVLATQLGATLRSVADDVKIQIEFNPDRVAGWRLLGYETRRLAARDFNDDRKDAGEIGAGHHVTAFYELVPAGGAVPGGGVDALKYRRSESTGSDELCTLKLRWKKPGKTRSVKREIAVRAEDVEAAEPSESFRFGAAVAEFAQLLGRSEWRGDADYGRILEAARGAKGTDQEGWRAEFIRLVELAREMDR